ncbi:hypothetical protein NRF20_43760 [Streptomyces sp. R-74717]
MTLSQAEADQGAVVPLHMATHGPCRPCHATGWASGIPRVCSECVGTGRITQANDHREQCAECGGRGLKANDPCQNCSGTGRAENAKTMQVRFPAGVRAGQRVRLRGRGAPGKNGGEAGDLFVIVHVVP